MDLLKREKYLSHVRPYYNKQLIKVMTGQRKVGKSYLLKQIAEELKSIDPSGNIIFIGSKELNTSGSRYFFPRHIANRLTNTILFQHNRTVDFPGDISPENDMS